MIEDLGHGLKRVTLRGGGLTARFLNIGAVLQDLYLDGWPHSIVLGFSEPAEYRDNPAYFGAMVGRYANRIANGRAVIDGVSYQFDRNQNDMHILHGGRDGAAKRIWQIAQTCPDQVIFTDVLPDGHMGFPGELQVSAQFTLLADGVLDIQILAQSDATTLCNFAHHSYFTLSNAGALGRHGLQIAADTYLPVDKDGIPTGEQATVVGGNFDFRQPKALDMKGADADLDHNFCLSDRRAARLVGLETGLTMALETTEPGLQVYTGAGLTGQPFQAGDGIALEPQNWPDAPNQPKFPTAILHPGARYFQHSSFQFQRG